MPLAKSKSLFEPELTSFADIAFLLIVFFILTTTFITPAGNKLDIPSASADPAKSEDKQLTITLVGQDIRYGSQGERVTLDDLRRKLLGQNFRAKPPGKRIVIVNARPDVPYELYFEVVMAIHGADGVLALLEEEEKAKK
ncbi:MAG TPA: biopolymer transporter ExbD [Planctomycetota bacterium]|nr:biopolymer transporter ExbD [Planctomycetota bacterium]